MDILERLLLPFAGLFFASSFPAVGDAGAGDGGDGGDGGAGGGEGGGDGGDGSDAGEGGDEGGDEGAGGEEGDTDGEEGDGEGAGEEGEGDGEGEGEEGAGRGGKAPDIESAIKKLRKLDPRSADLVRREHFQNVQYRRFGKPEEVGQMKAVFDLHGGEEGINEVVGRAERFEEEINMVASGNPDIVRDLARDEPEGLLKLVPHILSESRRLDPERFEKMLAGPTAQLLKRTGVSNLIAATLRAVTSGTQAQAKENLEELVGWLAQMDQLAAHQAEEPVSDREKRAIEREKAADTKTYNQYKADVGRASVAGTNAIIKRFLDPLLKGRNLTLEQKQDISGGIYEEIGRTLSQDKAYRRQMDAYYKKQSEPDEIAEYVGSKVEMLAERATKSVWARKGWAKKAGNKGAPGAGGGAGAGGNRGPAIMLKEPPNPEHVDFSKDPSRARWMGDGRVGEFTRKSDGRVMKFRWM